MRALSCSKFDFSCATKRLLTASVELKKHRAATHGDADLAAERVNRTILHVRADAGKVGTEPHCDAVFKVALIDQDVRVAAALFARAL